MTEIRGLKAVHYNQEKIKDLTKVVCPPYDVITPQQQNAFYKASEHNFVRIYLGKDEPGDTEQNNKYTRSRTIYNEWLKDGILIEDGEPGIYYYKQEYKIMGEKHSRLGFIALMRIQDEKSSKIFPHENTHKSAKEDRLRLWLSLNSILSPIFVCFADRTKKVEKIFIKDVVNTPPQVNLVDDDGVRHILWKLTEPTLVQEIVGALADQQLFIADGHHRYEVAKEVQRVNKEKCAHYTGQEPFNFVLTYFTDIESRDLKIFPIHRIIRHLPTGLDFLEDLFRIDKLKTKEDMMILLAKAGKNEHAFGFYSQDGIKLLRLKNKAQIDQIITQGSSEYRRLDASILKCFILDRLGVKSEDIIYTHDMNRATAEVESGTADACFIMNPVKIQQLKEIALNGERMPPKTTYFYPKVLSGLTVYRLGEAQ